MKITLKFLKEKNACPEGIEYFIENKLENTAHETIVNKLISENKMIWVWWLITRILTQENRVRYAIYASEVVLPLFEKEYPEDVRPREALEATKKWLISKSKKDSDAVYEASQGAYESYKAAYEASNTSNMSWAANAAYWVTNTAYWAESEAHNSSNAAYEANSANSANAAYEAAYTAYLAANDTYSSILKYGLKLINEQEEVLS